MVRWLVQLQIGFGEKTYTVRDGLVLIIGAEQTYTLMSTESPQSTRIGCKKLLESIGVHVQLQNADGMTILKCRGSEIRGGSMTMGDA